MIDGGWLVVVALDDPVVVVTPDSGLHRLGSVTAVLQSVIVPGGQVPPALAAVPPPELLAAPGPVEWLPGSAVGAGAGEVTPVLVAEGLLGALGAALVLGALAPDVPPDEVCAEAVAEHTSSDTATRDETRMVVMAGSHIRWMWDNGETVASFPISVIRLQTPA